MLVVVSDLTQNEIDVLLRYVASREAVKEGTVQRRYELIEPDEVVAATDSLFERGFLEWRSVFERSPWLEPTPLGREAADRLLGRD